MKTLKLISRVAALLAVCFTFALAGCSDNNNGTDDLGSGGGGGGGGSPDMSMTGPMCVKAPTDKHSDIINACTDATGVSITPFYPPGAPNGQLPKLN